MTVYVDELRQWAPTKIRCFAAGSCHLTADSQEELHAFAKGLGLLRSWHQAGSSPHYDLTASKRARALKLGASFVGAMEQARARLAARNDDRLCDLADGMADARQLPQSDNTESGAT